MQLLVSVRNAAEACVAVEGGADIIDAKDPARGPLGPVDGAELRAIAAAVCGRRPVSAAIGEVEEVARPESVTARIAAEAGVAFAKAGCGNGNLGLTSAAQLGHLIEAVRRYARPGHSCGLVLAAYADAPRRSITLPAVLELASHCGAVGVLLDTCRKDGAAHGLFDVMPSDEVAAWAAAARAAGLSVALSGSLRVDDIARAHAAGADLVGVRGAACEGGREGRISAIRVRDLARAVAGCHASGAIAAARQEAGALVGWH